MTTCWLVTDEDMRMRDRLDLPEVVKMGGVVGAIFLMMFGVDLLSYIYFSRSRPDESLRVIEGRVAIYCIGYRRRASSLEWLRALLMGCC